MKELYHGFNCRFEDKDFQQMDVEQIRASTPLRKRSPTPLDRLRSREPSPFVMPKLRLGSGTITPSGSKPADPHTYFSRSSSSQSLHQGVGRSSSSTSIHQGVGLATNQLDFDSFRAAMEAKQAEDESLPQSNNQQGVYSHSMRNLSWKGAQNLSAKHESNEHLCPEGVFGMERPSSAMSQMSEMSIHVGDHEFASRADSRMEALPLGDAISQGNLNLHSNFASRRGSEQQGTSNNSKYVASWLNKNNEDNILDDLKTPVNEPLKKDELESKTPIMTKVADDSKSSRSSSRINKDQIEGEKVSDKKENKLEKGAEIELGGKNKRSEIESSLDKKAADEKSIKQKVEVKAATAIESQDMKVDKDKNKADKVMKSEDETGTKQENLKKDKISSKAIKSNDEDKKAVAGAKSKKEGKETDADIKMKSSSQVIEEKSTGGSQKVSQKAEKEGHDEMPSIKKDKEQNINSRPGSKIKKDNENQSITIKETSDKPASKGAEVSKVEKPEDEQRPINTISAKGSYEPVEEGESTNNQAAWREKDSRPRNEMKMEEAEKKDKLRSSGSDSRPGSKLAKNEENRREEKDELSNLGKKEGNKDLEKDEPRTPSRSDKESRPGSKLSKTEDRLEEGKDEQRVPSRSERQNRPGSKLNKKDENKDIEKDEPRAPSRSDKESRGGSKIEEKVEKDEQIAPSRSERENIPESKLTKKEENKELEKDDQRTSSRSEKDDRTGIKIGKQDLDGNELRTTYRAEKESRPESKNEGNKEVEKDEQRAPSRSDKDSRPGSKLSKKEENEKDEPRVLSRSDKGSRPGSKLSENEENKEIEKGELRTPSRSEKGSSQGSKLTKEEDNMDIEKEEQIAPSRSEMGSRPGSKLNKNEENKEVQKDKLRTPGTSEKDSRPGSKLSIIENKEMEKDEPRAPSRSEKDRRPGSQLRKEEENKEMQYDEPRAPSRSDKDGRPGSKLSNKEKHNVLEETSKVLESDDLQNIKREPMLKESNNSRPGSRSDREDAKKQPIQPSSKTSNKDIQVVTASNENDPNKYAPRDTEKEEFDSNRRKRTTSISSTGFEQVEPAEWIQSENDEDELMIILDSDNYGLEDVEEEEELPERHPLGIVNLPADNIDNEAMEELELQYQMETGKVSRQSGRDGSRPSSSLERPPSILKGSREGSKERKEKDNRSRAGSRNSGKDALHDKKISFDDDYHPESMDNQMNLEENVVSSEKSRSQSKERPSSRTSVGSKGRSEQERKKSSSLVPELETIEIPVSLKEKLDRIDQNDIKVHSNERPDSPRPPSRPPSTGYTHLDEFERKLAEMEDELERDADHESINLQDSSLKRQNNMWNLVEDELKKENMYDGFYVNKEGELGNVDHSSIVAEGMHMHDEDLRSKKVSFAAADERYEIQRPGEVKTLGKNLYSLSPPKPMRKLPGKDGEEKEDILMQADKNSKEPSNEKEISKGFLASLSGRFSRSRSKTPDTEKESGSLFGSLLRKGKWGSRSASRQSSVDRDSQDLGSDMEGRVSRASDAGSTDSLVMKIKKLGKKKPKKVSTTDFDELFARGRAMSGLHDSDSDLDRRKEKKVKKNIQKDESIDYNEKVQAFLEDQAKSTEMKLKNQMEKAKPKIENTKPKIEKRMIDSNAVQENIIEPLQPPTPRKISTYSKPEEIKLSPVIPKKDIFTGEDLPQTPDEEFLARISNFVTNYSQKPNYEQVWPATPTKAKRSNKRSKNISTERTPKVEAADIIMDNSTQKQSLIETLPQMEDSNGPTGQPIVDDPISTKYESDTEDNKIPEKELDFLDQVSTFVTKYTDAEDYSQKIWPNKDKEESKKNKTMSPGRSYLEHKGETEWFARSIEADSYEAQKQMNEMDKRRKDSGRKNNLSAGAALMRQHMSAAAASPQTQTSGHAPEPIKRMSESASFSPQNKRVSSSQPPPDLSPMSIPRSTSSQSQINNEEFYTKLVIGLQKYTTPEPESRQKVTSPIFPQQLKKSQSETLVKAEEAKNDDKNKEFYNKLVTGLKEITTDASQETQDTYRKYSHHLGRAEFGTLKRRESTESNTSKLNYTHSFKESVPQSRGRSRDSSYENTPKISQKYKKKSISRQDSGEKYVRGQSRMSDTSETMPDLEIDDRIESVMVSKDENEAYYGNC